MTVRDVFCFQLCPVSEKKASQKSSSPTALVTTNGKIGSVNGSTSDKRNGTSFVSPPPLENGDDMETDEAEAEAGEVIPQVHMLGLCLSQ